MLSTVGIFFPLFTPSCKEFLKECKNDLVEKVSTVHCCGVSLPWQSQICALLLPPLHDSVNCSFQTLCTIQLCHWSNTETSSLIFPPAGSLNYSSFSVLSQLYAFPICSLNQMSQIYRVFKKICQIEDKSDEGNKTNSLTTKYIQSIVICLS